MQRMDVECRVIYDYIVISLIYSFSYSLQSISGFGPHLYRLFIVNHGINPSLVKTTFIYFFYLFFLYFYFFIYLKTDARLLVKHSINTHGPQQKKSLNLGYLSSFNLGIIRTRYIDEKRGGFVALAGIVPCPLAQQKSTLSLQVSTRRDLLDCEAFNASRSASNVCAPPYIECVSHSFKDPPHPELQKNTSW